MAFALMSALYGDFMKAVGASIRIFDLLDRAPTVATENGAVMSQLDGRKFLFLVIKFNSHFYTSRPREEDELDFN